MKSIIALTLAASALAGCSSAPHSSSVTQNEQIVRMAVVESVRAVTIANRGPDTGAVAPGTVGSGSLGGIPAGSNVGGANGSNEKAIATTIAGGIAGNRIEITVRLDSGELHTITQDADEPFRPGERVSMLSSGRTTRVAH